MQRTITHVQDTLDLSAKISVTRSVDDVDFDSLPVQHGAVSRDTRLKSAVHSVAATV